MSAPRKSLSERMKEAYDVGDNHFGINEVTAVESLEAENAKLQKLTSVREGQYWLTKFTEEEALRKAEVERVISLLDQRDKAEAALAEAQKLLKVHPNPDIERKLFRKAYVDWLQRIEAVVSRGDFLRNEPLGNELDCPHCVKGRGKLIRRPENSIYPYGYLDCDNCGRGWKGLPDGTFISEGATDVEIFDPKTGLIVPLGEEDKKNE